MGPHPPFIPYGTPPSAYGTPADVCYVMTWQVLEGMVDGAQAKLVGQSKRQRGASGAKLEPRFAIALELADILRKRRSAELAHLERLKNKDKLAKSQGGGKGDSSKAASSKGSRKIGPAAGAPAASGN